MAESEPTQEEEDEEQEEAEGEILIAADGGEISDFRLRFKRRRGVKKCSKKMAMELDWIEQ